MTSPSIIEEKKAKISEERLRKKALAAEDVVRLMRSGNIAEARQDLIFHTYPSIFREKMDAVINLLNQDFKRANRETKKHLLVLLAKLTLDLASSLPQWNLKNRAMREESALTDEDIEIQIDRNKEILASWSGRERALAEELLEEWSGEVKSRFKVEGVNDERKAEEFAAKLVGRSILEYINNMRGSFQSSNLKRIYELSALGLTQTEIGNDHTTNLEYAMWLGSSFVTTNPQLVETTLELNPESWAFRADEIIRSKYSQEELCELVRKGSQKDIEDLVEEINTEITMEIVLENAKMLRGIFLLSEGQKGLVCLQVNPLKHSDADAMIREALSTYSKLTERFRGVPNVVFKLPATKAGLEAAKELTSRGIGVTITVSFGLFQALPFAEIIDKGHAIVSYLVVMNGRLANPVIDELKKIGEDFALAGRWAGVAVAKRLYHKLYAPMDEGGQGYDSKKIRIVVASLRNYEGSFPDITELVGAPIITVFPNIRRDFDSERREISPMQIEKPIDDKILDKLFKSELFKQAYYATDDNDDMMPSSPFSLNDEEKVLVYPPVRDTLGQFCEYRIKMGEFVRRRLSMQCGQMLLQELFPA